MVTQTSAMREWREHWPVVAAAAIGCAIAQIYLQSMGVMIAPLEAEFGWSRTQITSGLLIVALLTLPLSPVVGIAIDRFGPRRIALTGIVVYSVSFACLGLAQSSIWSWWLLWLPLALGVLCLNPTVWVTAISTLFVASRGLAIAVSMGAIGVIAIIAPVVTNAFVDTFGWRAAYIIWGSLAGLIAFPVTFLVFRSVKDIRPSGSMSGSRTAKTRALTGFSLRDGLRSRAFVRLATVAICMSIASLALMINFVPILASLGMTKAAAAATAGLVGITQLIGRFGGGFLLDRFNARVVGAMMACLPIATCLLFLGLGPSPLFASLAVLIFGLAMGAEVDVIAYLSARYFGVKNFGALFGIIVGLLTIGIGVGPAFASLVYDITKSYVLVLWMIIPLFLASGLLLLTMGPYPSFDD
ncbi:MFS transporter [Sphingobium subterraneum]|uniref:MFS family permease n=1 Tax=Sphingobium subterraneum TaxID=627688 RepID=A0A841IWI9_9SPHN|nr:MFS transporter [Sphingobium subterraneum]MBB6122734.1 MFS family permease [Sphingobium subterraneum]